MRLSGIAFFALLLQLVQAPAWAGIGGVEAVGFLAQRAELVVVATIRQVTDRQLADGTSTETVELLVVRSLKGPVTEPTLVTKVVPGPRSAIGILSKSLVGSAGVWFLKDNSGVLEILPLVQGDYDGHDLFVPVQLVDPASAPTGTLGRQVLAYQLRWYESLRYPTPGEDGLIFQSLVHNRGQDAGDAIARLRKSAIPSHRVPGVAAAIRLGSSDALLQVAGELESLRARANFNLVLSTISNFLGPQRSDVVKALEVLAALHSDVPGLDDALSAALAGGIGEGFTVTAASPWIKATLPAMLLLLDSKDPVAQLRVARFFAYFSEFANADGIIAGTGVVGPFASADARRFNPAEGVSMSPARYAQFWKEWCAKNRKQLGF